MSPFRIDRIGTELAFFKLQVVAWCSKLPVYIYSYVQLKIYTLVLSVKRRSMDIQGAYQGLKMS